MHTLLLAKEGCSAQPSTKSADSNSSTSTRNLTNRSDAKRTFSRDKSTSYKIHEILQQLLIFDFHSPLKSDKW